MLRRTLLLSLSLLPFTSFANSKRFINVKSKSSNGAVLTFDGCSGVWDEGISEFLELNNIPSTWFVTSKFLSKNPRFIKWAKNNHLVEIQNHGAWHLAAIQQEHAPYGVKSVVTQHMLQDEVSGGAASIKELFGTTSMVYRGATAIYDEPSLNWFHTNNIQVGGYSVALDEGATLSERGMLRKMEKVGDEDVILAHGNHPERNNGVHLRNALNEFKTKLNWSLWSNSNINSSLEYL